MSVIDNDMVLKVMLNEDPKLLTIQLDMNGKPLGHINLNKKAALHHAAAVKRYAEALTEEESVHAASD